MRPVSKFKPVCLEADSEENMANLTIYTRQGRLPDADVDTGTTVLADKSSGVWAIETLFNFVVIETHAVPRGPRKG